MTFEKFAVAHPFFKTWFTSIDIANKHEVIIITLLKEAASRPVGSAELTTTQTIKLIPVQLELADASRDEQIQALFDRFEKFDNPPAAAPMVPSPV